MNKIFDVKCSGELFPRNITDTIFITWSLGKCARQKQFVVRIFDANGHKMTEESRVSKDQFFEFSRKNFFRPLEVYAYEIEVETDAFHSVSERQFFQCALTEGFCENAHWISSKDSINDYPKTIGTPAMYFKKEFTMQSTINANVYIAAAGLYELFINGTKVSDNVLEPAFTRYDRTVLYSVYNVENYLHAGENEVEVVLGNGWYNQTTDDVWGFSKASWKNEPAFIFQLCCKDYCLYSDQTWQSGRGPIVSNALRAGEMIDFRRPIKYSGITVETLAPQGRLMPQQMPPIRECETLVPISKTKTQCGIVYDFGKNISGWCSATISGPVGETVRFVYGEKLKDDMVDNSRICVYIKNPDLEYQTDTVILNGGICEYRPKFVYHGFRYVQIIGDVTVHTITAKFVHTDVERGGNFFSSQEQFNQLYQMSVNSILSNYMGFPTDCPHREKNGWTGDAVWSSGAAVLNFNMRDAYIKWLRDIQDTMHDNGMIPNIVPIFDGYPWETGPEWDYAAFRMTDLICNVYGETEFAKTMLPYLKKYIEYMQSKADSEGLYCYGLGDWCYPDKTEFEICPPRLLNSCQCLEIYKQYAKLKAVLTGENADEYCREENDLRDSILRIYGNNESLVGMCALTVFGIRDCTERVIQYFQNNRYSCHFGMFGGSVVFRFLYSKGLCDIAYEILARDEYPSFGYWVKNNQTSLCENYEMNESLNHHAFAFIAEYMMKAFGGIDIFSETDAIIVHPQIPKKMQKCCCSVNIYNGIIKVESSRVNENKIYVNIEIPPNTKVDFKYGLVQKTLTCGNHHFEVESLLSV